MALIVPALAFPAAALAHAALQSTIPIRQSSLDESPTEVSLTFDQAVTIVPRSIEVFAADGAVVSGAVVARDRGRVLVARLPDLARGAYTVRWRELSADGHIGTGVWTFGVGVPAPSPTEAVGASGLTWKDDVVRFGYLATLSLLLGALAVRLLVLRPGVTGRLRTWLMLSATVGAFGVINTGIAAFVLRGANALQLSFADLLYADLSPFAESTRFGAAFMVTTVGFGLVAALLLLAWTLDRDRLLWPAFVLAALMGAGLSVSGHQGTEADATAFTQGADWVHLTAASIWVGGLAILATVVWALGPDERVGAFLRFSRVATVAVAAMLAAGLYLAFVRLPAMSDLWRTDYGQLLLVKVAIVVLALGVGAFHQLVVKPKLERGIEPRGVVRSLLGEGTVAMAVLLVAAMLVNGAPPA
ncbi:MAG: copper resistance protein CopC [Gaiella sp.]